jgi:hypothetical protein
MNEVVDNQAADNKRGGMRWTHVLLIVLATIVATAGITYWLVRTYIYAKDFKPVELSVSERQVLDDKLRSLGIQTDQPSAPTAADTRSEHDPTGRLIPEKYSETGASRVVSLTERELNGLVASNPEMARKFAVDLSADLVSAKLLVPVDPDFPVMGGKTLRVNAGLEMAFREGRPIVVLKGVSIMGVPIPNAWLGGLKNIDLVSEFGADAGFWKAFADGVEDIRIADSRLQVTLKE